MVWMSSQRKWKKLEVLLHAYKCLHDHIILNCRISYDVALGTIASIVIVSVYSITSGQFALLSAIPFLIFMGGIIYCHIMYIQIKFDKENIMIENKINRILGTREPVLSLTQDLGIYSNKYPSIRSKIIVLLLPYAIGYHFSIWLGLYGILKQYYQKNIDVNEIYFSFTIGYIFITGVLTYILFQTYNLYIAYKKDISDTNNETTPISNEY